MSTFTAIRTRHVEDILRTFYADEAGDAEHGRAMTPILSDMIADIQHYCDVHHIPFTRVEDGASRTYAEEFQP